MIDRIPGEVAEAIAEHKARVRLRVIVGPYDKEDTGTAEAPLPYRNKPGLDYTLPDPADPYDSTESRPRYVCIDLSDRVVGIGSIAHRIALASESAEVSEFVCELDNSDNALSQYLQGSGGKGFPHWQLLDSYHIGAALRVEAGIRDAGGVDHFFGIWEGTVASMEQAESRVSLRALDPMSVLQETLLDTHVYDATAATIIRTEWDEETSTAATRARPIVDPLSFDAADDVSPFNLVTTNTGNAADLDGKNFAATAALVALHVHGQVWIDGRRRLRFVTRDTSTTKANFRIDYDRNLISGRFRNDRSLIYNKVAIAYGDAGAEATYEDTISSARYGVRSTSFTLPYLDTETKAANWAALFFASFGYPIPTYEATLDATGLFLELGDWPLVNDPFEGLIDELFQVHEWDFNPASETVSIVCRNTLASRNEAGVFLAGISEIGSGDRFL